MDTSPNITHPGIVAEREAAMHAQMNRRGPSAERPATAPRPAPREAPLRIRRLGRVMDLLAVALFSLYAVGLVALVAMSATPG